MKKKKGRVVMGTFLRYKPVEELKHWQYCDGCGKRFSELAMVWIDAQGWLCARYQRRIS
jgi:hypothetical protein